MPVWRWWRQARWLAAGGVALAGLAVALAGAPEAQARTQWVVNFHHDLPEDSPQHVGMVRYAQLVKERTGGQVEVRIFPANQLGDDREVTEQLQIGAVQGALIPTAKLSLFVPAMQLPDLPFLFPSAAVAHRVLDGPVGQALLQRAASAQLVGVAFWESGFKQFTANKALLQPEDFRGLKIRTMESQVVIEQFRALGANPVPIAFSETYNALQQGVVDGQENPMVSIVQMRFYEVQEHLTYSNHGYLGYAFLFSKVWFDRLPADVRRVLADTARELAPFEREETARREQGYLQTVRQAGVQVHELTPQSRARFERAVRPVHDRFAPVIGRDLLEAAYAEIEKLSSAVGGR